MPFHENSWLHGSYPFWNRDANIFWTKPSNLFLLLWISLSNCHFSNDVSIISLGTGLAVPTPDGDCRHEIKRRLLLGREAMTTLDSRLKSRDITLPTKVRLVKAMAFPVVMYGCESWTAKKVEHQRTDAFEPWFWRRLLKSLGLQGDQTSQS